MKYWQIRRCSKVHAIGIRIRTDLQLSGCARVWWALWYRAQQPCTCRERRYGSQCRDALRLSNGFEIGKEKCTVLEDGSANRASELVALEWRNRWTIKKVSSVKGAIPQELIRTYVKTIRRRTCNRINHSSDTFVRLHHVVAGT